MIEKNVPRLRFPGFEGEWEKKKLGDITSWASGGTPPKDNPRYWNGDVPWISASSMRGLKYSDAPLKLTGEGVKKGSKIAKKGSLLLLVRGSMLFNKIPIGIVTKDVAFNQDVKSIETDENILIPTYLLNWFTKKEPVIMDTVTATGIGAGKLDLAELKAHEIFLPSLAEQEKINSFVDLVNLKLTNLHNKKSLLEQYKKGMMQKIFNQETDAGGSRTPLKNNKSGEQLRFKDDDGKEFGEWEEKKLSEISQIVSGLSADQNDQQFGYLVTRIETISDGTIDSNKLGYVETQKDISDHKLCKGDILFSNINSVSHIGKTAFVNDDMDVYHGMNLLRIKTLASVQPLFLYYFLNRTAVREYMKSICNQAVSQASINQTSLGKTKLSLPSLKEQAKIANFLSAMDDKINWVAVQIEKCEEWKKGLLGEMFV